MKRFGKKTLALVLALMMALSLMSVTALAGVRAGTSETDTTSGVAAVEETKLLSAKHYLAATEENGLESQGQLGDSVYYAISGNVLYIWGDGPMDDYDYTSADNYSPVDSEGFSSVVIEEGVTSVGNDVFSYDTYLHNVELPSTLVSIGSNVFIGDGGQTGITLTFKGSAPDIDENAFNGNIIKIIYPIEDESWTALIESGNTWGAKSLTWYDPNAPAEEPGDTPDPEPEDPDTGTTEPDNPDTGGNTPTTTEPDAGQCGDNLFYSFDSNGVLTITGSGAMWVYSDGTTPWASYADQIKSVVMEGGSTLSDYAFTWCVNLESVTLSENLTEIGIRAFLDCASLKEIVIPAKVSKIGSQAFGLCSSLTEMTFTGATPAFAGDCFYYVTATAYYPYDVEGWLNSNVMQNYGGTITWAIAVHEHVYDDYNNGNVTTEPTCTESGYGTGYVCAYCNCSETFDAVIPALGHTLTYHAAEGNPCTGSGNIAYWSCERCGKYFTDENGENEVDPDNIYTSEALGHNYSAEEGWVKFTWTGIEESWWDGVDAREDMSGVSCTAVFTCTECGEKSDPIECAVSTKVSSATTEEEGSITLTAAARTTSRYETDVVAYSEPLVFSIPLLTEAEDESGEAPGGDTESPDDEENPDDPDTGGETEEDKENPNAGADDENTGEQNPDDSEAGTSDNDDESGENDPNAGTENPDTDDPDASADSGSSDDDTGDSGAENNPDDENSDSGDGSGSAGDAEDSENESHNYIIKWIWSDDCTTCTAVVTCEDCDFYETADVTENISVKNIEPSCTEPGQLIYTTFVFIDGEPYETSATVSYGEALGHSWDDVLDMGDGTLLYTCTRCGETRTVTVDDETEAIPKSDSEDTGSESLGESKSSVTTAQTDDSGKENPDTSDSEIPYLMLTVFILAVAGFTSLAVCGTCKKQQRR